MNIDRRAQKLLFTASRVIEFRHPNIDKYYVCYYVADPPNVVVFEWLQKTSAEVVLNDVFDFLIRNIIAGYKITSIIKSRDGKKSIKNNIFEKYYKLLCKHYRKDGDKTLDAYFRQFIYAVLTADIEGLRLIMIDINTHLGQFS